MEGGSGRVWKFGILECMDKWLKGLSENEVKEKLRVYGKNKIAEGKKWVGVKIFLSQFRSPLVYVLLFAAMVTFFLGEHVDTGVILFAVGVNTVLGFIQEYRAEKSLEALKNVLSPKAQVYREGKLEMVDVERLVPGDVVFLSDEHKVPADGVLIEEDGMFTGEAVLTGESAPVEKFDCEDERCGEVEKIEEMRGVFDQIDNKYLAFMGTEVKMGMGKMLVVKTGGETEMGKVASSIKKAPEERTPLQEKVAKLSRQLAILVGIISIIVLITGLLVGDELVEIFPTAVALAVAAIPEGLMVSLTVILAIGMQKILKRNAVVRKLTAAETLGSVDVICADKTGTLTEGKMRVTQAITGLGKEEEGKVRELVRATVLCNDHRDPLEVGMSEWAYKKGEELEINVSSLVEEHSRVDGIPFTSKNRYKATLNEYDDGQRFYISGAPELVVERSKLADEEKKKWKEKFAVMGSEGYRLVGFGYKDVQGEKKVLDGKLAGMEWLGFLAYEDPVREGVGKVIEDVQKAGISVKVITGDYRETAVAILRQIGILGDDIEGKVVEGSELEGLSSEELAKLIDEVVLFARTSPEQKLKIVEALKKKEHVVAMTGDGVNDAPALKRADIGVVVSNASEVSQETADMVLLDNNFKTIVAAIKEGRGIYDNLKRIIVYLLSDAFAEIIVVVVSIALRWPLPLVAVQILWINLVSDGFPDLALTVEPSERDVLADPPRKKSEHIVDSEVIVITGLISVVAAITTLGAFAYFWHGLEAEVVHARTVAFAMLGVNSLFYVFSSRSLSQPVWRVRIGRNKWLLWAVFVGLVLQVSVIYVPTLQNIFQTVALGWMEWVVIVGGSLLLMVVVEGVKFAYMKDKWLNEER